MTQPTSLPTADAQKQAAVEVFAQYEPQLYGAYLEMMLEWLAAVKVAMFSGGVATLGLVPDPLTVFSQTPKWTSLMGKYAEDVARDVLAAPYKDLFADGTLFESRPFVRNWIAARENKLAAVPTEVYGMVAQIIDSATVNGASIPDVAEQIGKLFEDADVPKWKNRARTVARTEVVGAYNGGLNDAFSVIVADDPETKWVKRWLATEDHRTRPDHHEADGQVVPFGQPFTVGAFQMMYPHDPLGPPEEVINCRCTMLLEVEGEPTDMGNRGYKDALTAGFNPAEKRGHDGKWTKGGGLLKSLIGKKKGGGHQTDVAEHERKATPFPTGPKVDVPPPSERPARPGSSRRTAPGTPGNPGLRPGEREKAIIARPDGWPKDAQFDAAASGAAALEQFPNLKTTSLPQAKALADYSGNGFESLNAGLAKGGKLDPADQRTMLMLDSALQPTHRTSDVTVWRGMRNPAKKFGAAWNDDDVSGLEWTQKGFSSTSADFGTAMGFASGPDGDVVMRVLIPKDAPVGGVDMRHLMNANAHENEALLGRNVRYRVVRDYGVHPKARKRYLDVEVVA